MNLYFVYVESDPRVMSSFDSFVVIGKNQEHANEIAQTRTGRRVKKDKTRRVPDQHYIVGNVFLMDTYS